jgi:hypothetical protein
MVVIVKETMVVVAAMTTIKEVGCLSSCFVLLNLAHHLSFQSPNNLEATMPLMMPFVWGILFGMHLLSSQETQVVCHLGHTMVAIIMETMVVAAAATAIKEVGCLSSCFVLLNLGHHLSFQSPKKLEAVLMLDTVLLALIPLETMTALHLVHCTIIA